VSPPPKKLGPRAGNAKTEHTSDNLNRDSESTNTWAAGARSVSWLSVHLWVQKYLDTAGHYPPAGTPAWCELADGDRRKWAALLDYAQHHALRVETAQEQHADASKAVAAAADWAAIAGEIRSREDFFAAHPWMQRRAA
jgi:hypothetical protein